MTTHEFSNELDTRLHKYNVTLSEYDKSLYLTRAQFNIVKEYVTSGIERSAKARTDLKELLRNHTSDTLIASTDNISTMSKFFTIPSDVFVILQEQCIIQSTNSCLDGSMIDVVPKTHDEYNIQINNPFKRPDDDVVWRLDYNSIGSNEGKVELISPHNILKYKMRYISRPEPIVLTVLSNSSFGEGLSIEGVTTYQTCKLDESLHRDILDLAIDLIKMDHMPPAKQSEV